LKKSQTREHGGSLENLRAVKQTFRRLSLARFSLLIYVGTTDPRCSSFQ